MEKITRTDLADALNSLVSRKDTRLSIIDRVFVEIAKALSNGVAVEIRGFGAFTTTDRAERQGRNPQTGEAVTIAARRAVKFKPGKTLKDKVEARTC